MHRALFAVVLGLTLAVAGCGGQGAEIEPPAVPDAAAEAQRDDLADEGFDAGEAEELQPAAGETPDGS